MNKRELISFGVSVTAYQQTNQYSKDIALKVKGWTEVTKYTKHLSEVLPYWPKLYIFLNYDCIQPRTRMCFHPSMILFIP